MSLEHICDQANNILDSQFSKNEAPSFRDPTDSHIDLNQMTLFKPEMKHRKIIHKKKKGNASKTFKDGFRHDKSEMHAGSNELLPKSERKKESQLLPEISNRNNSSEQLKPKNQPSLKMSKNKFTSFHR